MAVLRYGVGYHMTMVKEPHCDAQAVTDLVERMVNGAKQETDVGAELSFILPSHSSHQFPQLFDTLDGKLHSGRFRGCGECLNLWVQLDSGFLLT